jgi:hypothetical protein
VKVVIDALWYVAARSELVRLVVVRDFPGHERDDVFVSTDPSMDAKSIIETFARRWSLEHTFHECKGKLGFEDPQNRKDHAVERTAPMALWLHTLVVLWYLATGQHSRAARQPSLPWYTKTAPTFSDMLATLRRASWAERLSIPCANIQTLRKRMRPLVEALSRIAPDPCEPGRAKREHVRAPTSKIAQVESSRTDSTDSRPALQIGAGPMPNFRADL